MRHICVSPTAVLMELSFYGADAICEPSVEQYATVLYGLRNQFLYTVMYAAMCRDVLIPPSVYAITHNNSQYLRGVL